jgi:hypothetical protein
MRDKNNSANVLETRAGLIQRDGDIVDVDGQGSLAFPGVAVDNYYVSVRHRSHLGAMTRFAQSSTVLQTLVDFTVPATAIYDKGSLGFVDYTGLGEKNNVKGTYRALWAGDFTQDGKVKYDNPNDDNSFLQSQVVNYPLNPDHATSFDLLIQQLP